MSIRSDEAMFAGLSAFVVTFLLTWAAMASVLARQEPSIIVGGLVVTISLLAIGTLQLLKMAQSRLVVRTAGRFVVFGFSAGGLLRCLISGHFFRVGGPVWWRRAPAMVKLESVDRRSGVEQLRTSVERRRSVGPRIVCRLGANRLVLPKAAVVQNLIP